MPERILLLGRCDADISCSLFMPGIKKRDHTKDEPAHNQNKDGCFGNIIANKTCALEGSQEGDKKEIKQASNDCQQTQGSFQPTIGYFVQDE